jgi:hypothetical protein
MPATSHNEKHYGIFHTSATIDLLNVRARRVHIGTHAGPKLDRELAKIFEDNHWRRVWSFDRGLQTTKLGPIRFGDGVLSFINENPLLACKDHSIRQMK